MANVEALWIMTKAFSATLTLSAAACRTDAADAAIPSTHAVTGALYSDSALIMATASKTLPPPLLTWRSIGEPPASLTSPENFDADMLVSSSSHQDASPISP